MQITLDFHYYWNVIESRVTVILQSETFSLYLRLLYASTIKDLVLENEPKDVIAYDFQIRFILHVMESNEIDLQTTLKIRNQNVDIEAQSINFRTITINICSSG